MLLLDQQTTLLLPSDVLTILFTLQTSLVYSPAGEYSDMVEML